MYFSLEWGVVDKSITFYSTGRYVTVDIDSRFDSTCGKVLSIWMVNSIPPTGEYGRYRWSIGSIVQNNRSIMTVDLKVETIIGHELGLKNLKKYKFTYIYGYVSIFMYLHICTFICMLMIMLNIKIRQNKTTIMVLNQKKKNQLKSMWLSVHDVYM